MAEGANLEHTPTWVVAAVCSIIVSVSLIVERLLHWLGKKLVGQRRKPLSDALLKVKEELMLLGFISLLLSVFQDYFNKFCISEKLATILMPCPTTEEKSAKTTAHFQTVFYSSLPHRHLLAEAANATEYCMKKGKAPLLSLTALHELHIFIFVLAVSHVILTALTIFFGSIKIHSWKRWEAYAANEENAESVRQNIASVQQNEFIANRYLGFGKADGIFGWVPSFFKQFTGTISKADYITLRRGFIINHSCHREFNFHKYMIRAFEDDFRRVVGISWYLWIFVVIYLALNVVAWHAYLWIALITLILLLVVGTELEHIITKLAHLVAEKHHAVVGNIVIQPSDELFWFHKPRFILFLIHIILFQNAFELALVFFVWFKYGFQSCIMGSLWYSITRLVIGVVVQFICSYSTLPLYAIVAHMGSSFNKAIFDDHVQEQLIGWADHARKGVKKSEKVSGPLNVLLKQVRKRGKNTATGFDPNASSTALRMAMGHEEYDHEAGEIVHASNGNGTQETRP